MAGNYPAKISFLGEREKENRYLKANSSNCLILFPVVDLLHLPIGFPSILNSLYDEFFMSFNEQIKIILGGVKFI